MWRGLACRYKPNKLMEAFHADRHIFQRDERRGLSFVLALAMHALLALFLFVSVQWRTQRAGTVSVELWGSPPPAPVVETKSEPKPEPKVEPREAPKPQPKPEPVPEKKPDIVEEKVKKQAKEEKPKPQPASKVKVEEKPKPKVEAKPEPKAQPEKKPEPKKTESNNLANLLGQAMEQRNQANTPPQAGGKPGGTGANVNAQSNSAPGLGAGGGGRLGDAYLGQVERLIKSNLVYPDNRPDNPKAKIKVFLLPDGTIRDAQLVKSIGDPAYAEAARRAVITTHTFPPRPDGKGFSGDMREWTLSFCAKEVNECRID